MQQLKLSETTRQALKSLSALNPSLWFKKGNVLHTMNAGNNLLCNVEIEETFEVEFGIYELPRFLGVLTSFDDPNITLNDSHMVIAQGQKRVKYKYTDQKVMKIPPGVSFPGTDVAFDLSTDVLNQALKMASILQMPEIAFVGDGTQVSVITFNSTDQKSDQWSMDGIGPTSDTFRSVFKTEVMNLMKGEYKVEIAKAGIAKFTKPTVEYYAAVESQSSTYE